MFKRLFGKENVIVGSCTKSNLAIDLSHFNFKSSAHSRYDNGIITGSIDDCWRNIHITHHPNNKEIFLVTIYIIDESTSHWGDKTQMSTKEMRVVKADEDDIALRGVGKDALGSSFEDYGITLKIENNLINKIILFMYDRGVELHYSR